MSIFPPTCRLGDPSRDCSNLPKLLIPPKIPQPIKICWITFFYHKIFPKGTSQILLCFGSY